MSLSKRIPASIRYLQPKLKALTRPSFWVSATVLGLVLLLALELWSNPEWLSGAEEDGNNQEAKDQASDKQLSPDDIAAIGADIDNLPALMQEFTGKSASVKKQSSENKPEGFYEQMIRQQSATQPPSATPSIPKALGAAQQAPQASSNPFSLYQPDSSNIGLMPNVGNRLIGGTPNNIDPTRGAASPGLDFNNLPINQNTASVRALQDGLDQNLGTSTVRTQLPANGSGQTYSNTPTFTNSVVPPQTAGYSTNTGYNTPPTQTINNPPNSYTYPPQSVPIAPIAPSNYEQYPTVPQVPIQSGGLNGNSTFNSNLNNTGVPQPQLSQPNNLSTTRRIGRTIGGGQINTFSNP